MATPKRAPNKKIRAEKLFQDISFCPICGVKVHKMSPESTYKICPDGHGILSVTGVQYNVAMGVFLEIVEP